MLIRLIVAKAVWPEIWKMYWIVPIFKRGSKAEAGNYRGVHLTSQIPKIAERVIGRAFLGWATENKKW